MVVIPTILQSTTYLTGIYVFHRTMSIENNMPRHSLSSWATMAENLLYRHQFQVYILLEIVPLQQIVYLGGKRVKIILSRPPLLHSTFSFSRILASTCRFLGNVVTARGRVWNTGHPKCCGA